MPSVRTQTGSDEQQGAPEWMVTFSDCMTLLLTFFVLLLSFSSFDDKVHRQLKETMFMDLPTVYREVKRQRDAIAQKEQIVPQKELEKGSEQPTLIDGPPSSLELTHKTKSFRDRKVFMISSDEVFWGVGASITPHGNTVLATLAKFLKKIPGRIVIAETGSGSETENASIGLERSWAVLQHLIEKEQFDRKRISIGASSTVGASSELASDGRRLEIVLLERSVSN